MLKIAVPALGEESRIHNYLEAVKALGAEPVTGERIRPEDCGGLLLPGGIDVDPVRYGQEKAPETECDAALDEMQIDMLHRFMALGRPVFGICRGHQLINVALGGTLIQHLPTAKDHMQPVPGTDHVHECEAAEGSFIADLYGRRFPVNSSHHQGIDRPGKGIRIVLRAADGVAEALEHETLPIWGVQFHPERMCFAHRREDTVDGSVLLRWFVEKCR